MSDARRKPSRFHRVRSSPGSGPCCTTAPCPRWTSPPGASRLAARWSDPSSSPGRSSARFPSREIACDIHCVTRWSRYDNVFEGVPVQDLLRARRRPPRRPLTCWSTPSRASRPTSRWRISTAPTTCSRSRHDGEPLTPEHGGPVRLLVPHLYFWKSAKWVTGLEILAEDYPGFWEQNGYHMRGRSVGARSGTGGPIRCGCGADRGEPSARRRVAFPGVWRQPGFSV